MRTRNNTMSIAGVLIGLVSAVVITFSSPNFDRFASPSDSGLEVYVPGVEIGTTIRLPLQDGIGRKIPSRTEILVVAMSDCNSCSVVTINTSSFKGKLFRRPVLAVFPDTKSHIASGWTLPYAIDKEPSFLPASMRALKPQAVLLDANGKVTKAALGAMDVEQLLRSEVIL